MPDFTDLISQAKKMQEKMKETQEALKKIEVEGISGGGTVRIIMSGDGDLKKITFEGLKKENMIAAEDKILLYKIYIKIKKEFENLDKSKL